MVIKQSTFNAKAYRAFARSAIHSEHLNISIRAVFGERDPSHHKLGKMRLTTWTVWQLYIAIDMLAIETMQTDEMVQLVTRHIRSNAPSATRWFVGIRVKPRLHPWDQGEFSFPTSHWLDLWADSPIEARAAVQRLLRLGLAKPHEGESSPNADHVFAYALNQN